jgi:hypothetical protein
MLKEGLEMKVEMNKKYTSNRKPIRILCTDRNNTEYPVIGIGDDGSIAHFTINGVCGYGSKYDLVEVWEPELGEWCLFWDNNDQNSIILSRFYKMQTNGTFQSWDGPCWKYCKKFDGTLPKHLEELTNEN